MTIVPLFATTKAGMSAASENYLSSGLDAADPERGTFCAQVGSHTCQTILSIFSAKLIATKTS
jgi:hypothetical protein